MFSVYNSVYLYINIARYYHLNVHTYTFRYLRIVAAIYRIKLMKYQLFCTLLYRGSDFFHSRLNLADFFFTLRVIVVLFLG